VRTFARQSLALRRSSPTQAHIRASPSGLQASYDAGIKNVAFKNLTATAYCIENVAATTGGKQYKLIGPGGDIVAGLC